ncbi:MAG: N-acyl amino acid synthase FeeM domain-containing protein [Planctomycetota bacterium]|jgi:predicted GNAT family N-acyltransferase
MALQVRVAHTPVELEAIYRFRYDVYVREMGKPLSTADHANGLLTDGFDAGAIQYFVGDDTQVIGAMRLHAGNLPAAVVERLDAARFGLPVSKLGFVSKAMVSRDRRGSMSFLAMAKTAYETAAARGVELGLIHCRRDLVPLYERIGYRAYGPAWVDAEVGPQAAMVLDVRQTKGLLVHGLSACADSPMSYSPGSNAS